MNSSTFKWSFSKKKRKKRKEKSSALFKTSLEILMLCEVKQRTLDDEESTVFFPSVAVLQRRNE